MLLQYYIHQFKPTTI